MERLVELQHAVRVTQAAERGLLDMAFLADGVGIRFNDVPRGALSHTSKNVQFEPLTLLSALAMVTNHVGLVATASTTYNEPYHIARKFASLDQISGGRAGWNVVTSATDMVHARKADAAELLLVGEIDGRRDYSSLWLCLKEKPYESLEQLRGKPVAFASPTSTSGHLIPRLDLKKRGLIAKEPVEFFGEGNVWFGTGYMSGVERVLSGEAEAAAVSDYVFEKDKHMTPEQKKINVKLGLILASVVAVFFIGFVTKQMLLGH
jgi:hypothetical protein